MITFKQTDRINMMEILEYYPSLINDKKLRKAKYQVKINRLSANSVAHDQSYGRIKI